MVRRKEVCGSYSRTHYYNKVTKPLLERKKRVRINRCLEELKEYVVGALMAGFTQCAEETYNMILNSPEVDSQIGQQLVDHLQTIVGPLSIQVPNFRLVFSSDDGEKCRKAECCGGGLLMVADGGSQVNRDPDMWRPW